MNYAFKAINRAGQIERGSVRADSHSAAVAEIDRMHLTAIDVHVAQGLPSIFTLPMRFHRSLSSRELVSLTQGLASLLKAGLTLDRALNIMQATSDRKAIRSVCADLERRVRAGATFADALGNHASLFPSYYIAMARAGEIGGTLADGLERLSAFVEHAAAIRERIVSSLIYPAMLAIMILVTVVMVLTIVLPRFKSLFQESRIQLPWSTRTVMALGDFTHDYGWLCVLLIIGVSLFAYRAWRDPVWGPQLSHRLLTTPFTLGLIAKTQTSRFLRTLGTLAKSGVPLPDATGVAIGMLQNRALLSAARELHTQLRGGANLSSLLDHAGVFPKTAVQLARVGEETGRLEDFLTEAADCLDREAHGTMDRLLSILVPGITILMGAIVAGLIASVLVGILSLNDLAF